MDSIDRRVLLPKSLQEYFEQSEQLLIESLGESNFRRLLASIFVDKDDATLHDRMYEVEFQNILSSGLDTAIALRLALYVRILAVLRLESHEKISSIVGAQQGVIWDDVSGRALLQLGALFPQDTITREEYSQISDLLSLENIQDLILHTRFFNTMIGEECDEMQRKIARTFLKKISELLPTLEGHEYQEAIVCTSLLELLLGNKSGLQTLTIAANE